MASSPRSGKHDLGAQRDERADHLVDLLLPVLQVLHRLHHVAAGGHEVAVGEPQRAVRRREVLPLVDLRAAGAADHELGPALRHEIGVKPLEVVLDRRVLQVEPDHLARDGVDPRVAAQTQVERLLRVPARPGGGARGAGRFERRDLLVGRRSLGPDGRWRPGGEHGRQHQPGQQPRHVHGPSWIAVRKLRRGR
jgi:hypothetical protein